MPLNAWLCPCWLLYWCQSPREEKRRKEKPSQRVSQKKSWIKRNRSNLKAAQQTHAKTKPTAGLCAYVTWLLQAALDECGGTQSQRSPRWAPELIRATWEAKPCPFPFSLFPFLGRRGQGVEGAVSLCPPWASCPRPHIFFFWSFQDVFIAECFQLGFEQVWGPEYHHVCLGCPESCV